MQRKFLINLKYFNFDKGLNRCWIVFTICWLLIIPFLFFTDSTNYPYESFEKVNIATKEQLSFKLGKAIEIYRNEIINNQAQVEDYPSDSCYIFDPKIPSKSIRQTPEPLLKMFGRDFRVNHFDNLGDKIKGNEIAIHCGSDASELIITRISPDEITNHLNSFANDIYFKNKEENIKIILIGLVYLFLVPLLLVPYILLFIIITFDLLSLFISSVWRLFLWVTEGFIQIKAYPNKKNNNLIQASDKEINQIDSQNISTLQKEILMESDQAPTKRATPHQDLVLRPHVLMWGFLYIFTLFSAISGILILLLTVIMDNPVPLELFGGFPLAIGILAAISARRRNRHSSIWFLIGTFGGIVLVFIAVILQQLKVMILAIS